MLNKKFLNEFLDEPVAHEPVTTNAVDTENYFIFVLGYDLLHNVLNGIECDTAYEICEYVYRQFTYSDELKDFTMSGYDALQKFLENNKSEIENDLSKFYFNGRKVELC